MRLFIAIEISKKEVIDSIQEFQKRTNINARPVKPNNLHFTMQFLGEVSENIIHKIIELLQTIEFSSFEVILTKVGTFSKVVWIGTDKEGGCKLIKLSKKIQKTLEPLGFVSDKPFKPHITIFRIKEKIKDVTKELKFQETSKFGMQKISNIKLKKSELTSNGPVYSDLTEISAKE